MRDSVKFKKKSQVTIPKEMVEALGLEEGDTLECRLENGKIVLVPTITVPRDQAWFWTEAWQKGEIEADKDMKAGHVSKAYNNIGEVRYYYFEKLW